MQSQKTKKGRSRGKSSRRPQYRRKRGRKTSTANEALLQMLKPSEQDVMKLLAAQAHVGRRKCHVNMKRYIWKRRQDGLHIINLEKTWAKLILAARILVTVKNPADIFIMSTRTYGQRGAIKFAHYTGATALVGKWVPGTFTNPQNKAFVEPRLLIVDDPSTCFAALRETSYTGIPVVALTGTDNNTRFVDCGIPCNNRGKFSIGLMFWLLARELLRMRGDQTCIRNVPWKESVDLFFYRDADEIKRQQEAKQKKAAKAQAAAAGIAYGAQQEQHMEYDQADQPMDAGMYGDDGGAQDMDQQYMDYQEPDNVGAQDNWDLPQQQGIEDWDQGADQGGFDQPAQPVQQYEEQPPQQAQQPQQGGYQPNYGDPNNDGAMGMQTW